MTGIPIHLDFETHSNVDLKSATTHAYAVHESTDAWCMAYAIGDGEVQLWKKGDPFPFPLDLISNPGDFYFIAHNAHFELTIWNYLCARKYNWPKMPAKNIHCTMAMAYAMALPGSLENAALAVGMNDRKDLDGRKLMIKMASPHGQDKEGNYLWWDDEERRNRLYAYCKNDVVVERELEKRLQPLSDSERNLWLLDYHINDRGVGLDLENINRAMLTIEKEKIRINDAMYEVTSHMVKGTTDLKNLKDFIYLSMLKTSGFAKADVRDLLAGDNLFPAAKEALRLRQEGAKSSTAKLKAMFTGASPDKRIRGILQYHGAGTGRWAGRKIQPQNMPRGELGLTQEETEDVIRHIDQPDYLSALYGPPLTVISDILRSLIVPADGYDFIAADFSSIEARVLAWLAGQNDVLEVFKAGKDIYKVAAAQIFNTAYDEVTKTQRAVGKVAILALGYQGGIGAFMTMAKGYNVDMAVAYPALVQTATPAQIKAAESVYKQHVRKKCDRAKSMPPEVWRDATVPEVRDFVATATDPELLSYEVVMASDLTKQLWREANPITVDFWDNLNGAAMSAVLTPKTVYEVKIPGNTPHRQVKFIKSGSFLWCRLPSGRRLCYPYPKINEIVPPWADDEEENPATRPALLYMGVDSVTKSWTKQIAYGGLLAENITQAVARDFLVEAIIAAETKGYNVAFHVHDEIITEVPKGFGSVEELETLITAPTSWGYDCPIAAEGWRGNRYRK